MKSYGKADLFRRFWLFFASLRENFPYLRLPVLCVFVVKSLRHPDE